MDIKKNIWSNLQAIFTDHKKLGRDPSTYFNLKTGVTTQNKATTAEIGRLEQALEWTSCLTEKERKLVWWRAANMSWNAICYELGFSHTTAVRKFKHALTKIGDKLNRSIRGTFNK